MLTVTDYAFGVGVVSALGSLVQFVVVMVSCFRRSRSSQV